MPAPATAPLHGLSILVVDDKGKKQQWDAAERIDWSIDLDPENPQQLDDRAIPIYGSPLWDRLTHLRPDVVITDLSMPKRDGLWLLKWIRDRDAKHKHYTPVIAVTAHEDRYDLADLRFDACHVKPVSWRELLRTILVVTAREASASA